MELKIRNDEMDSIVKAKDIGTDYSYKHVMMWRVAVGFLMLHALAFWALWLIITGEIGSKTDLWALVFGIIGIEGIIVGAHRYYSHKSFKARTPLRALVLLAQTTVGQGLIPRKYSMFVWCRDHRLHHLYSDTDADPHNPNRGFFFSHIGWLMMKKHPYVVEYQRKVDVRDLKADWMVMFQYKYYIYLHIVLGMVLPMWIPVHYYGETWLNSFLVCYVLRSVIQLNLALAVNSIGHRYGTRAYDKNIQPADSGYIHWLTLGEGWHNYHHVFPWDYKAQELPTLLNLSTDVIKLFEWLGLAYDLKTPSAEMIRDRMMRTGDGTYQKRINQQ